MSFKVISCAGHVLTNIRPHQLRWVDQKTGNAISCTECNQVTDLSQKVGRISLKALSLHAAVLSVAVFHSKIVHNNHNC